MGRNNKLYTHIIRQIKKGYKAGSDLEIPLLIKYVKQEVSLNPQHLNNQSVSERKSLRSDETFH